MEPPIIITEPSSKRIEEGCHLLPVIYTLCIYSSTSQVPSSQGVKDRMTWMPFMSPRKKKSREAIRTCKNIYIFTFFDTIPNRISSCMYQSTITKITFRGTPGIGHRLKARIAPVEVSTSAAYALCPFTS
jgi:hypothetical protein